MSTWMIATSGHIFRSQVMGLPSQGTALRGCSLVLHAAAYVELLQLAIPALTHASLSRALYLGGRIPPCRGTQTHAQLLSAEFGVSHRMKA